MGFLTYKLVDPDFEEEIRYIGFTRHTLEQRLTWHLISPTNVLLVEWFAKLQGEGRKPRIIELGSYETLSEAMREEAKAIKANASIRLLNIVGNRRGRHTRSVTCRVPPELLEQLREEAIEQGLTISQVVSMRLLGYWPVLPGQDAERS